MIDSYTVLGSVKGARFDYLCDNFDSLSHVELSEYRQLCNIMRDAEEEEDLFRFGLAQRTIVYSPGDVL